MDEQPVDRWQDYLLGAVAVIFVFILVFLLLPVS